MKAISPNMATPIEYALANKGLVQVYGKWSGSDD